MRRSRILASLGCLLLTMALPAVARADPFRLIVTDLTTPLVPNSVMELAKSLGYFEREGVDVELIRIQETPLALSALGAGEGDMANVSVDATLRLVARGQMDLRAVVSPNKSLPYIVAAKNDIATPRDLEGKSFGVGRVGSLDHSLSLKVISAAGVDTSRVQIVALGQPNIRAQALAAGRIDATTISIGAWRAMADPSGLHVLIDQDAYYRAAPIVSKVNVVTAETLAGKRTEIAAVVRALVKASRDFAADPAKWVDAMAVERPDVDRKSLEELARAYRSSWSVNGGLSATELAYTADWLYHSPDFQKLARVALKQWVDFSVLDEVLATEKPVSGMDEPSR